MPRNTQELKTMIEKMIAIALPKVLINRVNNIRLGTVQAIDTDARTVNVTVHGTGETLTRVKYQKGGTGIAIGDTCYLLAQDPKNQSQVKAIIF